MRIERVVEELGEAAAPDEARSARTRGFVALKTIAAYRGGLDLEVAPPGLRETLLLALEANEASGDPLPVQVHCGFGDWDLHLPRADPGWLKPLIERFRDTPFVLLHCYPFVREAGWLAHVYGNVWFDLSLTIPHVSRPAEVLREALELAPASKLLYASDAARSTCREGSSDDHETRLLDRSAGWVARRSQWRLLIWSRQRGGSLGEGNTEHRPRHSHRPWQHRRPARARSGGGRRLSALDRSHPARRWLSNDPD